MALVSARTLRLWADRPDMYRPDTQFLFEVAIDRDTWRHGLWRRRGSDFPRGKEENLGMRQNSGNSAGILV
jgi:hypothetical protein